MKFKAFSLAEIMIAMTILGVVASLTIPSTMEAIKYREHLAAYKVAFAKVASVFNTAPTDGGEPRSTYRYAQNFWNAFYSSAATLGFVTPHNNIANDSPTAMNTDNIKVNGKWGDTVIGSSNNPATMAASSFSPWIVLENKMAFTFRTRNKGECQTNSLLLRRSIGSSVDESACLMVIVDVNGLEEGPNKIAAVTDNNDGNWVDSIQVYENQMYNLVKDNDRFRIFISKTGASEGSVDRLEYWMRHTK